MKRLLFIVGTFALMMLSLGFLFKVMQYEGAGLLIIFGLTVFTLVLIAGAIRLRNLLFYSSSMTFVLLILAWAFKTLHLPGAELFYMAGNLVLTLVIIPLAGYWIYKHS
jgi:hypothetical protein